MREKRKETMPYSMTEIFSLIGCIAFLYVAIRSIVRGLYRLVCWAIRKLGGREYSCSPKVELLRRLVVLADLVSEGNEDSETLKALADELLNDELLPQLRRSLWQN